MKRDTVLARMRGAKEPVDMLIIGGGATGLGAAVEAAARGHRVVLLERADFAQGTSSRSTKLVHGGVRYLKQGNILLVLGALRERGRLMRNAPHLVHALAFVIPIYHWWPGLFYRVGLKVYDLMAGRRGLVPSRWLNQKEVIARLPTIKTRGLRGGVMYHDGQFDDARLAVNLAQTADALGAMVLNHCAVTRLLKEQGKVVGVEARDEETGEAFAVRSRVVINATGVFVDEMRRQDDSQARPMVAVSQGVHLVLPKRFLPGAAALMIPKTADGRVLFAVPWHGRVIVGTTDTPLREAAVEPRALDEERDFLLAHISQYLAPVAAADVLSIYAGLRPLVKTGGGGGSTAALSRDHTIVRSASGLLTITGGKWTTYRKMGQAVIDQAEQQAGVALGAESKDTKTLRLHGWSLARAAAGHWQVYGADAEKVKALAEANPVWRECLHERLSDQKCAVVWAVREEMARTVEDVLARRTRALFLDARASIEAAPEVARIMAGELGRDKLWEAAQVRAYTEVARGYVFTDSASGRRTV